MQIGRWHFIVAMVAGWLCREQEGVIHYLKEENRVLREMLGTKRLRFTDAQRSRLARKGRVVGGRRLRGLGCIVTPDTILRWYRQLVANKYDGSNKRVTSTPPHVSSVLRSRARSSMPAVRACEAGPWSSPVAPLLSRLITLVG